MTQEEREKEAGMLMMLLDQDKENIAALRKLLIHGAISPDEHTTIFGRLRDNVKETLLQLELLDIK